MTSPTKTVVGKGISNSLIAEGLLKSGGTYSYFPLQNSLPIPVHGMVRPQKSCNYFSSEIITKSNMLSKDYTSDIPHC